MNAIVAVNKNYEIGRDNELLFRIPKDLENFKNLTTGKVIVYGYNTLNTFPKQKPLKNRTNIILTTKDIEIEGAIIVHSLDELFKELEKYDTNDVFVVGGESVYKQLIDYCDTCYLTKVYENSIPGNKYFPRLNDWEIENCTIVKDGPYDFTYKIKKNPKFLD